MGRPRLNSALPKYASSYKDRHGRERVRLRRTGWQTAHPKSEPGTPEFTQEYREWLERGRLVIGAARTQAGTFDDVIGRYYRSPQFTGLKPTTQNTYKGELERFRAKYGERRVATMTARHVSRLMENMAGTPSAANNLKKRLSQIFNYAIVLGIRRDNPTRAVRAHRIHGDGHKTWQEEQIARFEAAFATGTRERLAFDLALYTAQRRSDICSMGPQHLVCGKISVRQLKTGKALLIPVHPNLARSIAATPTGARAFIARADGAAYTKESFGNWFGQTCRDTGLEGYSLHGLRKAASRRMAELGLSNQLIKSITGHSSDSEVARYTRDAEQERMADLAMAIMAESRANQPEFG